MNTTTLPFEDRYVLALQRLADTYVERENFLSDDDVLDAAEEWTTDVDRYETDDADWSDYERLRDALFAALVPKEER